MNSHGPCSPTSPLSPKTRPSSFPRAATFSNFSGYDFGWRRGSGPAFRRQPMTLRKIISQGMIDASISAVGLPNKFDSVAPICTALAGWVGRI